MLNPAIVRFVSGIEANRSIRLDLNTETEIDGSGGGWRTLHIDLGQRDLEQTKLSQMPFDGDLVAAARRPNRKPSLELLLQPQTTWAALVQLRASLEFELDRDANILEYRFAYRTGEVEPESFFLYTERAPIPALLRRQQSPNPAAWLRDIAMVVELEAQPTYVDTNGDPVPF